MSIKKKELISRITPVTANLIIILGLILLMIYLLAPLFGGKLFLDAIIKCASWISIGLGLKIVMNRIRREMRIGASEHLLLWLILIFNLIAWFAFPMSLIFAFLGTIGLYCSYRRQNKRG